MSGCTFRSTQWRRCLISEGRGGFQELHLESESLNPNPWALNFQSSLQPSWVVGPSSHPTGAPHHRRLKVGSRQSGLGRPLRVTVIWRLHSRILRSLKHIYGVSGFFFGIGVFMLRIRLMYVRVAVQLHQDHNGILYSLRCRHELGTKQS